MKKTLQPFIWAVNIIIFIFFVDLFTKQIASEHLVYGVSVEVFPFLDWLLVHNYGAAFGFLAESGGWQKWLFLSINIVVSLVLLVWIWRLSNSNHLLTFALACITGGALGNAYGRAVDNFVVDFVSFHYDLWHFPAFNVADAAISLGAACLVLDAIKQSKKPTNTNN